MQLPYNHLEGSGGRFLVDPSQLSWFHGSLSQGAAAVPHRGRAWAPARVWDGDTRRITDKGDERLMREIRSCWYIQSPRSIPLSGCGDGPIRKSSTETEGIKKEGGKASKQQPRSDQSPSSRTSSPLQLEEMLRIPNLSTSPGKYMWVRPGAAWQLDKLWPVGQSCSSRCGSRMLALKERKEEDLLITHVSELKLSLLQSWLSGERRGFMSLLSLSYGLGLSNTEPKCCASSGQRLGAGSALLGGGHGVFVLGTGCTRARANRARLVSAWSVSPSLNVCDWNTIIWLSG